MLKTSKKLLPLAPLLAYFLPTKRSQKKSDKAMAAASLLGRRKQPDQECATPGPPPRIPVSDGLKRAAFPKPSSQQQNHTPKNSNNSAAFWYQCCTRQCQENATARVGERIAVRGGCAPDKIAPPPRAAPKPRSRARKRIKRSRVGFQELTGTVHSSALPPALQELLPEAAARKRTKKRGIKEGRGSKEAQAHAHTYIRVYCVGSFPLNVLQNCWRLILKTRKRKSRRG
jgi:hypothetical protein